MWTARNTNSALLQRELQRGSRQINDSLAQKTKEGWQGRRMHGHFPHDMDGKLVGNEQSYQWQKCGDIKGEIASTKVVSQDQALKTCCCKNKFWRKKVTVNASCVNNMKKELPPNLRMPHFGEE